MRVWPVPGRPLSIATDLPSLPQRNRKLHSENQMMQEPNTTAFSMQLLSTHIEYKSGRVACSYGRQARRVPHKSSIMDASESGGIGRRARLRIWSRKGWGFESPLSHQQLSKDKNAGTRPRVWRDKSGWGFPLQNCRGASRVSLLIAHSLGGKAAQAGRNRSRQRFGEEALADRIQFAMKSWRFPRQSRTVVGGFRVMLRCSHF